MAKSSAAAATAGVRSFRALERLAAPGSSILRLRLVLFALACMGFGLLLVSAHLLTSAWKDQREIELRAQSIARGAAQTVDQEVAAARALLIGLSASPYLADGNLMAFHSEASAVSSVSGLTILLLDSNYRGVESNLVSTTRPFGSAPPQIPIETENTLRGLVEEVRRTQ
ncbi:MAG TPA: hypothetical protein VEC75_04250, partial [Stellaceae bacterium]|nr:hypothetical protein [Stellaceae bacterium]